MSREGSAPVSPVRAAEASVHSAHRTEATNGKCNGALPIRPPFSTITKQVSFAAAMSNSSHREESGMQRVEANAVGKEADAEPDSRGEETDTCMPGMFCKVVLQGPGCKDAFAKKREFTHCLSQKPGETSPNRDA